MAGKNRWMSSDSRQGKHREGMELVSSSGQDRRLKVEGKPYEVSVGGYAWQDGTSKCLDPGAHAL
jgi:hypothetical protein